MVSVATITRFLNKELQTSKISDVSRNGLQVKASKSIKKIGFAVDACLDVFLKAKKAKCDLLIVHHGLFWKKYKDVNGIKANRVQWLKKNKISLYANHLPLDRHRKYGNNISLCNILGLSGVKLFGKYKGVSVGYIGEVEKSQSFSSILSKVNKTLKTKSFSKDFAKKKIKKVAVVSGGGDFAVEEAIKKKADLFVTGEFGHELFHIAKEKKLSVIAAGHYATEVLGVKALMPLLKDRFGVDVVFLDVKTGL
jgi:dinuclear metal center YbgI/SA1388 family protein